MIHLFLSSDIQVAANLFTTVLIDIFSRGIPKWKCKLRIVHRPTHKKITHSLAVGLFHECCSITGSTHLNPALAEQCLRVRSPCVQVLFYKVESSADRYRGPQRGRNGEQHLYQSGTRAQTRQQLSGIFHRRLRWRRQTVFVRYLRNRRWGGCVYVLQIFFLFSVFFVFFSFTTKYHTIVLSNGGRIFMKLLPNDTGENVVWKVVPPLSESRAAAWRMANVDDCVIYDMTLSQSPDNNNSNINNSNSNLRYELWLWQNHQRAPRTAVALYNNERANWCNLVIK